jgi:hypothetical protein
MMQFQSSASKSLQPSLTLLPIIIRTLNRESRLFCYIFSSLAQCPNYVTHNWSTTHDTGSQLCLRHLAQGDFTNQAPKTHTILEIIKSISYAVAINVRPVISTYLPPQYAVSETKLLCKYLTQTFYVLYLVNPSSVNKLLDTVMLIQTNSYIHFKQQCNTKHTTVKWSSHGQKISQNSWIF